jgi:hypothetical protein
MTTASINPSNDNRVFTRVALDKALAATASNRYGADTAGLTIANDPVTGAALGNAVWNQLDIASDDSKAIENARSAQRKLETLASDANSFVETLETSSSKPDAKNTSPQALFNEMRGFISEKLAALGCADQNDPATRNTIASIISGTEKFIVRFAATGQQSYVYAILQLLTELVAAQRNSDLNSIKSSLKTSLEMLSTMQTEMNAQINNQFSATNIQNFIQLGLNIAQTAATSFSMFKSAGLMKQKDNLFEQQAKLPAAAKDVNELAVRTEQNAVKVNEIAQQAAARSSDTGQANMNTVAKNAERITKEAEKATDVAGAIEPAARSFYPRQIEQVRDQLASMDRFDRLSDSIGRMGAPIGTVSAASTEREKQTAENQVRVTENQMQLEQQYRSFSSDIADGRKQAANQYQQTADAIRDSLSEQQKAPSRA